MAQPGDDVFLFGAERAIRQPRRVQARIPADITTKTELLDALAATLGFPDYFGRNWDALEECIRDLSWLDPEQVVLIHDGLPLKDDPASLKTYLSILRDAVLRWRERREHELVVAFPEWAEVDVRRAIG